MQKISYFVLMIAALVNGLDPDKNKTVPEPVVVPHQMASLSNDEISKTENTSTIEASKTAITVNSTVTTTSTVLPPVDQVSDITATPEKKSAMVQASFGGAGGSSSSSSSSTNVREGVKIGETDCASQDMCSTIAHSQCKEGICQCLETHVPNLEHRKCLRIAGAYKDPCEIDKQCPKGSKCLRKVCTENNESGSATTAASSIMTSVILLMGAMLL